MLTTIIVLLILLWVLGMGTGVTSGGLLHLLLVLVAVVVLIRIMQGRPL